MIDWQSFGAGVFAGAFGRALITKLFSKVGGKLTGVYRTIVDATRRAFNDDVKKIGFNFRDRMSVDFRTYRNGKKLQAWLAEQQQYKAYRGLLLQGWLSYFSYPKPLGENSLEFWDKRPLVLSFGIYFAKTGRMVEYGINLHYLPRGLRLPFLADVFELFKAKFKGQMYSDEPRPLNGVSWELLQKLVDKYHLEFAVHSYIPELRRKTVIIDFQDWGKALALASDFTGITEVELQRMYRQHVTRKRRDKHKL